MPADPKPRIATAWLDGCSGCHMSVLDMDELIVELADQVAFVYSPVVDIKQYPDNVDVAIVEGAVSSEDDLHKIQEIRAKTRVLVALGDCAVTSNVPGMRNQFPRPALFRRAYHENAQSQPQTPDRMIPALLERARPIHEHVAVDVFVPGCPPPADAIVFVVTELLAGRIPQAGDLTRFGR